MKQHRATYEAVEPISLRALVVLLFGGGLQNGDVSARCLPFIGSIPLNFLRVQISHVIDTTYEILQSIENLTVLKYDKLNRLSIIF